MKHIAGNVPGHAVLGGLCNTLLTPARSPPINLFVISALASIEII
jgi:hypothetical protein